MKKLAMILLIGAGFFMSGCAPKYDYTIHKPKVRYKTPSKQALGKMLPETHGKKYVWAEEGPRSFDCSGLTYYNYGSMNLWLPRRAEEQARMGSKVAVNDLQYGDLIFFDTSGKGRINHVGIYVGNRKFTHASSKSKCVVTTSIDKPFYRQRIVVCKRVIPSVPAAPRREQPTVPSTVVIASATKPAFKPKAEPLRLASNDTETPKKVKLARVSKNNVYNSDRIVTTENSSGSKSLY